MATHRKFWSTLLLALLLLQTTVSAPWLHRGEAPQAGAPTAMAMAADGTHHCHDGAADQSGPCKDRGCVFCGVAPTAHAPRVDTFFSLLSQLEPFSDRSAHHFEQPVELRPPQPNRPV
ncbi:hypothetical protein [Endothiovibrio diazotrophicus]